MLRDLIGGALYFAMVFVFAVTLGYVRTRWLEPAFGDMIAVACEVPVLIAVMYAVAPYAALRGKVSSAIGDRLVMGVFALLLQQMAELGLVFAAGETLERHIAYLQTPAGLIYLFGLAAFVAMPALRRT